MGIRVEGCLPKTATAGDGEVYYSVSCLVCRQTHLVHSKDWQGAGRQRIARWIRLTAFAAPPIQAVTF